LKAANEPSWTANADSGSNGGTAPWFLDSSGRDDLFLSPRLGAWDTTTLFRDIGEHHPRIRLHLTDGHSRLFDRPPRPCLRIGNDAVGIAPSLSDDRGRLCLRLLEHPTYLALSHLAEPRDAPGGVIRSPFDPSRRRRR
jgi:hypothetical protein